MFKFSAPLAERVSRAPGWMMITRAARSPCLVCVETQAVWAPSDITLALVRTGARAQVDHRMYVLVSVAVGMGAQPVSKF